MKSPILSLIICSVSFRKDYLPFLAQNLLRFLSNHMSLEVLSAVLFKINFMNQSVIHCILLRNSETIYFQVITMLLNKL